MEGNDFRSIKAWNEDDRPREKMLSKGSSALSDTELLAILIGSGTRQFSAIDVARSLFERAENNLHVLSRLRPQELMRCRGVGEARAVTIAAALELGRRRQLAEVSERPSIESSNDAYRYLHPRIAHLQHEEFWMLCVARNNRVIGAFRISTGGLSSTVVDTRLVLRTALENNATSILLSHNHPSGNPKPSEPDRAITKTIAKACSFMDITLLDHIIVVEKGFFSFRDAGEI